MAMRTYGQYCGVARALELVGERWALLLVRDLIPGPKRFTDLQDGLPRIPSNVLSTRLKELEQAGIVQRRVLPRPAASVVYELTEYGGELEEVLVGLMRWGAKSLGDPRPDDAVSANPMIFGLRASFRDLSATYELHVDDAVLHARIEDGALELAEGPAADPDLTIEADLRLGQLMSGEITPAQARSAGIVRLTGDAGLLDRFAEVFTLPPSMHAAA